jgi:hypothetical protein
MTDRVIILAMLTGTWLVAAWGTFAVITVRRSIRRRREHSGQEVPRQARIVAFYVATRQGKTTVPGERLHYYHALGATRAAKLKTLDPSDAQRRKNELRSFLPRQSQI